MTKSWPSYGCGVGLRSPHYNEILATNPRVDWFEAISENFMDSGGKPISILEKIRKNYPIALHGVALSIGSTDPLNQDYLSKLKRLADRIEPFVVSDHLCWSSIDRENLHDLLPLPFTEEAISFIASRVEKVQDFLKRKILMENVSTYVTYKHSVMPEWEFLTEVARRSGCGILLDLNNIYVNAKNHGFEASDYVEGVPAEYVGQFHLAGHTDMGKFLFDTHSADIVEAVWDLYKKALTDYGQVSTLVEWDEHIPDLAHLLGESEKAKILYDRHNHASLVKKSSQRKAALEIKGPPIAEVQRALKPFIQPGISIPSSEAKSLLNPQGGEAGERRMSIYAGGYITRMTESLSEVFAAIKHLLGESAFQELALGYAKTHPSHEYNLNLVGRFMPDYIKMTSYFKEFPFLGDLADLEWATACAFHSFEKSAGDFSKISAAATEEWERTSIEFQPSVKIMASQWPLYDLWAARNTPKEKIDIDLINRAQKVLVGRSGVEVFCKNISELEFECLALFLSGKTLGEVCERLAESGEGEKTPLNEWFIQWAKNGMIAGLHTHS